MRRRFQRVIGVVETEFGVANIVSTSHQEDGTYKVVDRGKSFPGLSERAARAAMKPILDAVNKANKSEAQFVVPVGARTVNDAVADWRKLVAPHRKPRGVETTESHLKAHIIPELGHVPLSQVNVRLVQEFVNKITLGAAGRRLKTSSSL